MVESSGYSSRNEQTCNFAGVNLKKTLQVVKHSLMTSSSPEVTVVSRKSLQKEKIFMIRGQCDYDLKNMLSKIFINGSSRNSLK